MRMRFSVHTTGSSGTISPRPGPQQTTNRSFRACGIFGPISAHKTKRRSVAAADKFNSCCQGYRRHADSDSAIWPRHFANSGTQCNRTQSPAGFSRNQPQCRKCAEIFGSRENINFRTRRPSGSCKKPANGGLFSDIVEENLGDRTGWLTTQDSNSKIPFCDTPFEISAEFPQL
jgi:hypothetical protein